MERRLIALALAAGRKRQRPQTGFVHHCYEGIGEHDTIPLFENACFALALFRSRLSEHILEGKALLEKILAFEVDGNFPVYLHEYPECKDRFLAQKMVPIFYWVLTCFKNILGDDLRDKLSALLQKLPLPHVPENPRSPAEWAKCLIASQIKGESLPAQPWNRELVCYMGPAPLQMQEKREPALTLYDFFMGQLYGELPKRALEDHPIHLQASLVHPFSVELPSSFPSPYNLEQGLFLAWGGREHLHSLFSLSKFDVQREGEAFLCTLTLPETFPQEGPSSVETSLFCNLHEETTVLVNGVRATTFALGDRVSILSQGTKIELTFSGEGIFFGHLSRANRPNQLSNKGDKRFDAYDWQIALRTIRRPATCTLRLHIYA